MVTLRIWQEEQFHALVESGSGNPLQVLTGLKKEANECGFDYFAYGIQMPVPISKPSIVMTSNYPRAWQQAYSQNDYIKIDPTVKHCRDQFRPIVWTPQLFRTAPQFWEEAQGHGLRYGWAQSVRSACGAIGMLTLARTRPLVACELRAHVDRMMWLVQFVHASMEHGLAKHLVPELEVPITLREREVLRWTAEGKTMFEVSQILSISENTVTFHLRNIVAKLGCSNKIQAAVKAVALGLL